MNEIPKKRCTQCVKLLPATSEYFYKCEKHKDGLKYKCISCWKKLLKEYRDNLPGGERTRRNRNNILNKTYGISEKRYNEMFIKQNGFCWICGIHQSKLKISLSVDHNHKTGKVRGLLCTRCNLRLAVFEKNIYVTIKSIEYLRKYL
jgi:hypothetical protein